MNRYNRNDQEKEIKENFCPSCLVMPLAFVGAGAVVAGEQIPNKHKKWKKMLLVSGVITLVSLLGMILYFYISKKGCDGTCSLKGA